MAAHLRVGESEGGLECPKCRGGMHNDKAFSITRVYDGILFHCFRASCGFSGFINTSNMDRTTVSKSNSYTYRGDLERINAVVRRNLIQRYGLHLDLLDVVKYSYSLGRVMYPVHNAWGTNIGWVARYYSWNPGRKDTGKNVPKTLSFHDDKLFPWLHFSTPLKIRPATQVVLVEDWLSAEKVNSFLPTVALLGSHLSKSHVRYLRDLGVSSLILWLDSDAFNKANSIKNNYNLLFKSIDIIHTKSDPKDLNYNLISEEIDKLSQTRRGKGVGV